MKAAGLPALRKLKLEIGPTFFPVISHSSPIAKEGEKCNIGGLIKAHKEKTDSRSPNEFFFRSALDYVKAYKSGDITPVDVAHRIIEVKYLLL
jgi:hypothetical protein